MRLLIGIIVLIVALPCAGRQTKAADGVEIAYQVAGSGEPALVFIHCWACDQSLWLAQIEHFRGSHRVVSLDLPGHGASGADRSDWSVEGLGEDVARVIRAEQLEDVVLVGHSMGGPVSLAAAALLPERVRGVVCIDTLHDFDLEWDVDMADQMLAALAQDFDAMVSQMAGSMFPPDHDPAHLEAVLAAARQADQDAAVALIRDFRDLDQTALAAGVTVPIRCVNAAAMPPVIPPTDLEGNQAHADFDVELIEGVGHYLQLEKPAEVNAAIERALADIEASTVGAQTATIHGENFEACTALLPPGYEYQIDIRATVDATGDQPSSDISLTVSDGEQNPNLQTDVQPFASCVRGLMRAGD